MLGSPVSGTWIRQPEETNPRTDSPLLQKKALIGTGPTPACCCGQSKKRSRAVGFCGWWNACPLPSRPREAAESVLGPGLQGEKEAEPSWVTWAGPQTRPCPGPRDCPAVLGVPSCQHWSLTPKESEKTSAHLLAFVSAHAHHLRIPRSRNKHSGKRGRKGFYTPLTRRSQGRAHVGAGVTVPSVQPAGRVFSSVLTWAFAQDAHSSLPTPPTQRVRATQQAPAEGPQPWRGRRPAKHLGHVVGVPS